MGDAPAAVTRVACPKGCCCQAGVGWELHIDSTPAGAFNQWRAHLHMLEGDLFLPSAGLLLYAQQLFCVLLTWCVEG